MCTLRHLLHHDIIPECPWANVSTKPTSSLTQQAYKMLEPNSKVVEKFRVMGIYFLHSEGYAPFQSTSIRESFLTISEGVAAAPGPGHYSPTINSDGAKGGRPLHNKVCLLQ